MCECGKFKLQASTYWYITVIETTNYFGESSYTSLGMQRDFISLRNGASRIIKLKIHLHNSADICHTYTWGFIPVLLLSLKQFKSWSGIHQGHYSHKVYYGDESWPVGHRHVHHVPLIIFMKTYSQKGLIHHAHVCCDSAPASQKVLGKHSTNMNVCIQQWQMSKGTIIPTQLCIKCCISVSQSLSTEVCHNGQMPDPLQLPPPHTISTLPLKIKPHLPQTKRSAVLINYYSTWHHLS